MCVVASCYYWKSTLLTSITFSRYFRKNVVFSTIQSFRSSPNFLLPLLPQLPTPPPLPPRHFYCFLFATTTTNTPDHQHICIVFSPPLPPLHHHLLIFTVFISLLTDLLTTTKVFYFPSTTTTTTTTFLLFFPPAPLLHFYCFSFVFLDRFKVHVNECDTIFSKRYLISRTL